MGGVCLVGGWVVYLFGVVVVGGDQQLVVNGFYCLSYLVDVVIQCFNCFYGSFYYFGMVNYIVVWVVIDDGIVFFVFDGGDQFFGQFGGVYFWLQIVGCYFW